MPHDLCVCVCVCVYVCVRARLQCTSRKLEGAAWDGNLAGLVAIIRWCLSKSSNVATQTLGSLDVPCSEVATNQHGDCISPPECRCNSLPLFFSPSFFAECVMLEFCTARVAEMSRISRCPFDPQSRAENHVVANVTFA
ncbi:hypothetical protein B0J13DRAFT_225703 [Dactylonectria estremocensis]|uniref:Secreted protein n=1 Tax=Dactylonectria estremocensis TaxID=1079267 RepID=A0A9P9JCW8_9HYPO|nr:hypothetical protein B0J13DRAFT_225703 [Dactylonectria estremocensis]